MRRIPRIYIAGPYSALTLTGRRQNVLNAEQFAAHICDMGAYPVTPHLTGWHAAEMRGVEHSYEWWCEATSDELLTCDAVYLVPGWQSSKGTLGEKYLAETHSVPIFTETKVLRIWLDSWIQRWKLQNAATVIG